MATMGELVRKYRERKGWSQGQLATYSGLTQPYISKLEKNFYISASPPILQKLADALGAPLKELLEAAGITDAPERPVPLPSPLAQLRAEGMEDHLLDEMLGFWERLMPDDRERYVAMARALWEQSQTSKQKKAERSPRKPKPASG